ncbi:sigma-70 family RNA polymerase sigma factor [Microbacterium esteraromaticum]|uniref:RNA polymerase sigma factor n=1 Tax=Microbacterium esteraromaticum TaxID=57043 RepID=UPI0023676F1E|nr:sigma-70 family RNA polymerase sigma factor [Microbacterium esteraromaticum]WDH79050.1 sigma-70 family RNA polymerase sigma factor [Microbacterium esteraromaticum]
MVVAENADDLLRYLLRRVDAPEDAADLLGRVLLALWEGGARVPTVDPDARMWCFGIARNILREHYRHSQKRLALADDLRDHLRDLAIPDNAADTAAEAQMRAHAVRTAVLALDERYRELVMLVHWDGFSLAEAARLLALNESTARTRYARALRRLEESLNEYAAAHHTDHVGMKPECVSGL